MAFQPIIGTGGYGGWKILGATEARQRATFEKSPMLAREAEYFRQNIAKATTPEALVKDRRLLSVALAAFGLGEEIYKRAFIQKALEGGTDDPSSFANRLNEPRYKAFVKAFGFGNIDGPNIGKEAFSADIIARYKSLEFERAVGDVDPDIRLAMNFKREIQAIASAENADRVGWLQIMGQLPLRKFASAALGIPDAIAKLDVDKQKEIFESRSRAVFGEKSAAVFKDPAKVDDAIRRFFLFRQIENGPSASTPGAGALSLLQMSALGSGGYNLFLSQR